MKRAGVYCLLLTVYCLLFFITACEKKGPETQVGRTAPDFHLKDIKGEGMTLSGQRGKIVLLRFWSTRCPSCKEEMPGLEKTYKGLKDKGLEVLAINVEDPQEVASNFTQEMGITYPILLDEEQKVARIYNVFGIPTTFFIDKEGVIRERVFGDMKEKTVEGIIISLLEGRAIPRGEETQEGQKKTVVSGQEGHKH